MSDVVLSAIPDSPPDQGVDLSAEIAALREAGAERFDPLRFHYLEVLLERMAAQPEKVRRILEARLLAATIAFKERFEHAQHDAEQAVSDVLPRYPQVAEELQQLRTAGEFSQLRQRIAILERGEHQSALSQLPGYIEQQSPVQLAKGWDGNVGSRSELKAIRYFRNTWSKLSVDKQVAQAIDQGPENPGPLNSHMLVLRSLEVMRDISPDYLNRFMSYVDTLLCLDQADKKAKPPVKKPLKAKARKS